MKTAIILAGGYSERFGKDKGLIYFSGKPLIIHILDKVYKVVNEIVVVVSSIGQKDAYSQLFSEKTKISIDIEDSHCSLVGALTGFMNASGDYSILLPCDMPFISREVIEMLFSISPNMNAVIPRWPNGYIEPLHAVYRTKSALMASKIAYEKGEKRMQSMVYLLNSVRYVSTIVVKDLDPSLTTFFNVNTPADLKKAESLVRKSI